jgi:hypothetical protein
MKPSELHFQAAQCCIKIEILNKMIKAADSVTLIYLNELKDLEMRRYAELLDHITTPLNLW